LLLTRISIADLNVSRTPLSCLYTVFDKAPFSLRPVYGLVLVVAALLESVKDVLKYFGIRNLRLRCKSTLLDKFREQMRGT